MYNVLSFQFLSVTLLFEFCRQLLLKITMKTDNTVATSEHAMTRDKLILVIDVELVLFEDRPST